jgi:putative PIN family toxin of toxin-antitoxin system
VRPIALLDTTVWISALLNPHGPPVRLKDAWLRGKFEVVVALPLLAEIGEVLRRPRIKRKYGIREEEIVRYLRLIAARSALVPVAGRITACRDPDDNFILEAAVAGKANFIVTRDDDLKGDLELIQHMQKYRVQVVSVSYFLDILSAQPNI